MFPDAQKVLPLMLSCSLMFMADLAVNWLGSRASALVPSLWPFPNSGWPLRSVSHSGSGYTPQDLFLMTNFIASCFLRIAGALEKVVQMSPVCDHFDSKWAVLSVDPKGCLPGLLSLFCFIFHLLIIPMRFSSSVQLVRCLSCEDKITCHLSKLACENWVSLSIWWMVAEVFESHIFAGGAGQCVLLS